MGWKLLENWWSGQFRDISIFVSDNYCRCDFYFLGGYVHISKIIIEIDGRFLLVDQFLNQKNMRNINKSIMYKKAYLIGYAIHFTFIHRKLYNNTFQFFKEQAANILLQISGAEVICLFSKSIVNKKLVIL